MQKNTQLYKSCWLSSTFITSCFTRILAMASFCTGSPSAGTILQKLGSQNTCWGKSRQPLPYGRPANKIHSVKMDQSSHSWYCWMHHWLPLQIWCYKGARLWLTIVFHDPTVSARVLLLGATSSLLPHLITRWFYDASFTLRAGIECLENRDVRTRSWAGSR